MKTGRALSVLMMAAVFGSVAATAATVDLTTYSTAYASAFYGFAYDPGTQQYYSHDGYGLPAPEPVNSYSNAAAFQAGLPSGNITVTNNSSGPNGSVSPPTGTYFVVNNGMLYGRPDDNSNNIAEWNATTGALVATTSIPGVGGTNFTDTFNWGGFSALNLFDDNGTLYMLAMNSAGTNWEILQLAPDLTVTNTIVTSLPTSLGYAFAINGELFVGDSFYSNAISYEVNLSTGAMSSVNYTLGGDPNEFGNGPYLSDLFYDQGNDTLFAYDTDSGTLYDTADASVLFDAPSASAAPEPGTFTLLLSGMLGVGLLTWIKSARRPLHVDLA